MLSGVAEVVCLMIAIGGLAVAGGVLLQAHFSAQAEQQTLEPLPEDRCFSSIPVTRGIVELPMQDHDDNARTVKLPAVRR